MSSVVSVARLSRHASAIRAEGVFETTQPWWRLAHARVRCLARGAILSVLIGLGVCSPAEAAQLQVEISGIEGDLLENVRATLELTDYVERDVSLAQVRLMFSTAEEQIRTALRPFGYYHVEVTGDLQRPEAGLLIAQFRVDLGMPVIVQDVHVEVKGPAAQVPEVRAALASFEPEEGERLQHALYENSKERVDAELREAGFLDAELLQHRVAVTRASNSANIDVVWESGERYRFGPVRFSDSQFREEFLRGYVPWEQGDKYSADEVLALQQRLVDAGYFSVVSVQPQLDERANGKVPIEVTLVPDERTLYTAGLYVTTDAGPGGRLDVERRWLNRRGHRADAHAEYSPGLREVSATYGIPQPGPFQRDYTIGAAYTNEKTDTSTARMTSIAAAEGRKRWRGFTRSLGVQYVRSDFDIGGERRASDLLYADAVLSRRRTDDPLFPLSGYTMMLGLRASPGGALSDTNLVQLRAEGKWIRSVGRKNRIILRGALGAMTVGDFDMLPPRLRFFAGGDRSIRGFDYESIGERNDNGAVIGGEFLATIGIEYERFILPNWGAAVFVDGGDAFTAGFDAHVGAGIGLRWKSPVGIFRLDVAKAIDGQSAGGWRIHLMIGPDL